MHILEELLCVFSAEIEQQHGSYVIEVPKREIEVGDIQPDEVYRAALFSTALSDSKTQLNEQEHDRRGPPVEEGQIRTVEIEDLGEQGDGIARVERGYILIVPETDQGDRVTVKITDVRENVAFAEVVKREDNQDDAL